MQKELYLNEQNIWELYPYIITCTHNGTKEEKYDTDKTFYERLDLDGFTLDNVTEVVYTDEQLARLDDVRGLKYKDYDEIYDYVINGVIKPDSQIFIVRNVANLDKSINEQSEILADIIGGVY